jgi:uncharacterized protein with HEPN domain
MKDDRIYLDHILDCINWIRQFTEEGAEFFSKDRRTQSAVLRELQTLSESTQRLSDEFREKHPEVPWQNIAGFRNILVHGYLGIKMERIWEIIQRDLPLLESALLRPGKN